MTAFNQLTQAEKELVMKAFEADTNPPQPLTPQEDRLATQYVSQLAQNKPLDTIQVGDELTFEELGAIQPQPPTIQVGDELTFEELGAIQPKPDTVQVGDELTFEELGLPSLSLTSRAKSGLAKAKAASYLNPPSHGLSPQEVARVTREAILKGQRLSTPIVTSLINTYGDEARDPWVSLAVRQVLRNPDDLGAIPVTRYGNTPLTQAKSTAASALAGLAQTGAGMEKLAASALSSGAQAVDHLTRLVAEPDELARLRRLPNPTLTQQARMRELDTLYKSTIPGRISASADALADWADDTSHSLDTLGDTLSSAASANPLTSLATALIPSLAASGKLSTLATTTAYERGQGRDTLEAGILGVVDAATLGSLKVLHRWLSRNPLPTTIQELPPHIRKSIDKIADYSGLHPEHVLERAADYATKAGITPTAEALRDISAWQTPVTRQALGKALADAPLTAKQNALSHMSNRALATSMGDELIDRLSSGYYRDLGGFQLVDYDALYRDLTRAYGDIDPTMVDELVPYKELERIGLGDYHQPVTYGQMWDAIDFYRDLARFDDVPIAEAMLRTKSTPMPASPTYEAATQAGKAPAVRPAPRDAAVAAYAAMTGSPFALASLIRKARYLFKSDADKIAQDVISSIARGKYGTDPIKIRKAVDADLMRRLDNLREVDPDIQQWFKEQSVDNLRIDI